MNRADAIKKLLSLGPMPPDQLFIVMGGELATVKAALKELVQAREVEIWPRMSRGETVRAYALVG